MFSQNFVSELKIDDTPYVISTTKTACSWCFGKARDWPSLLVKSS